MNWNTSFDTVNVADMFRRWFWIMVPLTKLFVCFVSDFQYLPGQHPGFSPFSMLPSQWLDAAYMSYWPEYFRQPSSQQLCKLAALCPKGESII